jgi:hypothetical protein
MERPSRLPLYVGIALLIVGWAVIFIGWYQSGQQDLETGQLPYVISGGFGGFGLIIMGVIAILADVVRQAESKLRHSAEELHHRMEELAEIFVRQTAGRPAPGADRAAVQEAAGADRSRRRRPRQSQQRPRGAASSE